MKFSNEELEEFRNVATESEQVVDRIYKMINTLQTVANENPDLSEKEHNLIIMTKNELVDMLGL